MTKEVNIKTHGRSIALARPDKVLFPADGAAGHGEITKLTVARYYARAAPYMLPYLKGRPLVVQRYPDGIREEGFYQKRPSQHYPDWLKRINPPLAGGGSIQMLEAEQADSLVYLAGQGAIVFHHWLSLSQNPRRPVQIIWDLDPALGGDFSQVKRAARWVAELLRELGLRPFVKTTGSKGLHVTTPLRPELDFEEVRQFAEDASDLLAARHPRELTTEQRKQDRKGRVYLDVMRNALGQTAVAPYSLRPLPGAPVAAPLDWEELERKNLGPQTYNLANIFRRLGQKRDPWSGLRRHARSLTKPAVRLEKLLSQRK